MQRISSLGWSRFSICLLALPLSSCAPQMKLQPFASDGCSAFPDRSYIVDKKMDWCRCCFEHDLAYWRGGTAEERLKADETFRSCVLQTTSNAKPLADVMFNSVRLGGGPEINTPYRWGYGWTYGRNYTPLTADETKEADKLQQEYLAKSPLTVTCPALK